MRSSKALYAIGLAASSLVAAIGDNLFTDLNVIQRLWGEISSYADNPENSFGVNITGLPSGCQVEQAHVLQRHAQRFPTSGADDGGNDERFASKVKNFTLANPSAGFTGPLSFLNSYEYTMGESYLTSFGAVTEVQAGATFWARYGRNLYNATSGQLAYNASFPNGTARPKPVLRTTSQSRIENSEISWAIGFFGQSFNITPNPEFTNATQPYNVVIIPEGGTENNTLASYDSCLNADDDTIGFLGDADLFQYLSLYLQNATTRMQQYAPEGFTFNVNDTYAMQSICAYESQYIGIGMSQFCGFFTKEEWQGFEYTTEIQYFNDYAWGNPTGRAQGIGYVQELLARLQHQFIPTSNSSVNATIDQNSTTFPLDQKFYADFSHDDIIISVLTAMSIDYFNQSPNLTQFPPDPNRHFVMSKLTPFGGRLVTEVIGCNSSDPMALTPSQLPRVQYYPTQYGYDPNNATNKFIRMRINNGIIPLNTIQGGNCDNKRPDGLCAMEDFIASQANATTTSQYQFACFGNYTISDPTSGQNYNGVPPSS